MRIQILVTGLVCVVLAQGQSFKTNWANNCFMNPASNVCKYHDFAIKPARGGKKEAANKFSSTGGGLTTRVLDNAIDWRFADPQADALAGFHVSGLAASPLARTLIAQLGARQNLTEADTQRLFDGLASVDQIALSIRDNRVVAMITGRVKELTLPADGDLKAVMVSGTTMLFGHADAVDQAAQRLKEPVTPEPAQASQGSATGGLPAAAPASELAEFAAERQSTSEFWATASGQLVGPEAVSDHLQRLSLAFSLGDRFAGDFALEFDGPPSPKSIETWQPKLGVATVEGNGIYLSVTTPANQTNAASQKFAQIVASPFGERLSALVAAARNLPLRDLNALKQTHAVIYGLDNGPRVVNQ
jgi:hypothetical protein